MEAEFERSDEYGDYYVLRGGLTGPNGVTLDVKSVWIMRELAKEVLAFFPEINLDTMIKKFILCYPHEP